VQRKRDSYRFSAAAAGASLPAAIISALPNGNVVDEARFVNRTKHPMRVSKLSACRTIERGWATNQWVEMCQWLNVVEQVIQGLGWLVGRTCEHLR
jgi:hypothetical protein